VGPTSVTAKLTLNERTLGEMQLPAYVEVSRYVLNKHTVEVKSQKRLDPKLKLLKGDEITFCALPHRLPLLLEARHAKLILSANHRVTDAEGLAGWRESLLALLGKLAHWLQSRVRIRIAQRIVARKAFAAVVIQCAFADFYLRQNRSFKLQLTRRGYIPRRGSIFSQPSHVLESESPTSSMAASPTTTSTSSGAADHRGWGDVRKHRHQVAAAATMTQQLKRVRQKKKPSQVRKAKGKDGTGSPGEKTAGSRKAPTVRAKASP